MHRNAFITAGVLAALVAAVVVVTLATDEPKWRGRRASEWLANLPAQARADDECVLALREMQTSGCKFLVEQVHYRTPAWYAFVQRHARQIPVPLQPLLLKPPPPDRRSQALQMLALLGTNAQPAVPHLLRLANRLLAEEEQVQSTGRTRQSSFSTNVIVQPSPGGRLQTNRTFIRAASDSSWLLRPTAYALERIGGDDPAIVQAVVRAGRDGNYSLSSFGGGYDSVQLPTNLLAAAVRCVPWLEEIRIKGGVGVRCKAISFLALTLLHDQRALPVLTRPLADELREVQRHTLGALRAVGPNARAAAPAIRALVTSDDRPIAFAAAQALWEVNHEPEYYRTMLIENLQEPSEQTIWYAAKSLGQLGSEAAPATSVLISHLTNASDRVRGRVAITLGEIGPAADAAIPALATALSDEYRHVRDAAKEAINRIRGEPVAPSHSRP
jgi:HEAT repeat protein